MTASLIPILTLIEHKSELVVGCVLLGQNQRGEMPPAWFTDSALDKNPAARLLRHVDDGEVLEKLDVFLVVKEPNSLFQFSVFAAVGCCNLNYSGEGGSGGEKVLELLAKHGIRTYPAEVLRPTHDYEKSLTEWHEEIKECFKYGFNVVAREWLPASWGVDAVLY